ncbi:MAG: ABC transporter ATP-binding protein [Dehalococcoidia bacterium]|nr:ABC transporter ATP-binding protein [Dehalococcoidia bacterium]
MNFENEEPAIRVAGLHKRYGGETVANNGIDLTVSKGEIFALLGHNGVGKTTLVRQVTGELMPTSGEITVCGVNCLRHPREARRFLGIVPQEAALFGHLTVEQHLSYFGRLRGLDRRTLASRIDELMQQLHLGEHRKKLTSHLSGGLKRKLLVGIAMIARPPVLVLDEPTTGLDPFSRHEVWALVRQYQLEGMAVLLTTHYMDEAENLADRVGIVSRGRLLTVGTIEELHGLIGHRYKLTYSEPDPQRCGHLRRVTAYGRTADELRDRVAGLGLEEYNVARTGLEDIYMEIANQPLSTEVNDAALA